jgi:DNA-binding response OmpR family regulator
MGAHILVVEDEEQARYSLVQIVRRAGYKVAEAADGETALQLLARERFDLVLVDIRLGAVDGLEVLRASRRLAEPPAVIMLTGHGSLESSLAALRAGAADYLLKPSEPEQMLVSVATALEQRAEMLYNAEAARIFSEGLASLQRRLLGRADEEPLRPGAASAIAELQPVTVGPLRVGRHRYEVYLLDQSVHLTPMEFAILRCLAENWPEPVSYQELSRCAYGYAASGAEAQVLLKAHVRNLRQKIGATQVATVRGTGYRLAVPGSATLQP